MDIVVARERIKVDVMGHENRSEGKKYGSSTIKYNGKKYII